MRRPPATDASGWRERARSFATRVVEPVAAQIDREDRLPEGIVHELGEEGFLGLGIPERWDGAGGDTRAVAAVLEELSRASAAVAVLVAVHLSVCAAPILTWGTDAQRARFLGPLVRGEVVGAFGLTEPSAGSDTASLRTRYVRDGAGFLVNGSKTFISNAASAGLILVFATSDPARGHRGISAFIVPPGTGGFTVVRRLEKLGLRGSETTELVLEDVRLPADAMLGTEGEGLHVALGALQGGRIGIASCALGVADAAFAEMRRAVAADDADWKRTLLARAYADLEAARALVARAASAKDAGAPYEDAASVAKLVASRAAVAIASAGVDVAGVRGATNGANAERLLRDARVFPIVEGTTEIQELILARRLLAPERGRNPL
jgi:alkylation response protein AidB-like acyl-CoA dehydrogenase